MVTAINNFKVGDIVEQNFGRNGGWTMAEVDDDWKRFWDIPLRDAADIKEARELVESHGSNLGWAHEKLNQDSNRRSDYRTVTP